MSEILPSSSYTQGQITLSKMTKNLPHSWHHSQKTWNPKTFFFRCGLEGLPHLRVCTVL